MGNIKIIKCGYVNSFLIKGKKSNIIVDTGTTGCEKTIIKFLEKESINPETISLIIITHGHFDHFGGLSGLKNFINAPVAIHRNDYPYLLKGINAPVIPSDITGKIMTSLKIGKKPGTCDADIIIDNNFYDLSDYGINGGIIFTPGHTKGSLSVITENEIISGDNFMKFIRLSVSHLIEDKKAMKETLEEYMRLKPRYFYLSHGGVFSYNQIEKVCRHFLKK
ncbi:MAG: MBL fold metallo-hydrolase [Thermotogae bacterium]|nr:MBL fold metallo-hydrolase [Thermotogota bacterium]